MIYDNETILTAVQNMINRFGDDALAEVDLRIEELKLLKNQDAVDFWIEIRKAIIFKLESSDDKSIH